MTISGVENNNIRILCGLSPNIKEIRKQILEASQTDLTVLIQGPSGTGKDIIAHNIHYYGNRKNKPFVNVNIAGIPEKLINSELFGIEIGAFTGATKRKVGLVETANNGTLFLDEIGDLPTSAQVSLLTFLEKRTFYAVGGTKEKKADVRVIAATNRKLRDDIENRNFREDLFHRLNRFPISVMPLRERKEDLIALIQHFSDRNIDPSKRFLLYYFPYDGNVRELESIMKCDHNFLWNSLKEQMTYIRESVHKRINIHHLWQNQYLTGYDEMVRLIKTKFLLKKDVLFFLNPHLDKKAIFSKWETENLDVPTKVESSLDPFNGFFGDLSQRNLESLKLFIEYHSGNKIGDKSFQLNVIRWCTELFEILTLHTKAHISRDTVADILKIRRSKLVDLEFEATYGVYLDEDDDEDDFHFPHELINHHKIFNDL